jgi:hypothetical protein
MKASRRGFFAFGAGAAVAAPAAVKSVLAEHEAGLQLGSITKDYGSASAQCMPEAPSSTDYLKRRLTELVKERESLLAPTPADTQRSAAHRIDGLRSVSAPNRARMVSEEMRRREVQNSLSWLDRRTAEVKEELGMLGALL